MYEEFMKEQIKIKICLYHNINFILYHEFFALENKIIFKINNEIITSLT